MKRKPPKDAKPANQYDKIFKENIEAVIPNLIANLLDIQAVESEEIPDDLQHTKERKPDVLKKITDQNGNTFILQIEFQVGDEPEMVYRMADYYLMLRRKYKLPVEQYVLFVGPGQPKMAAQLAEKRLQFEFSLLVFSQLNYTIFLRSDKPEEVLLAILADFKQQTPETVVSEVIRRIDETAQGDFSLKRYFQQLRVLAQLRNLETQIDKTMDSIAEYINEEKDVLYIRGQRKAREEENRARETEKQQLVERLLTRGKLTILEIAEDCGVSTDFVLDIQRKQSHS